MTAPDQQPASSHWPLVLAVGVFVLALWAQLDRIMVGAFGQDGIYVALGSALGLGEGYRHLHLPGAPPGVQYPVLYPTILGFLWRLWPTFPDNVTLFQLFDAAALAGASWLTALYARRHNLSPVAQYIALPLGFLAFPLLILVGIRSPEPVLLLCWVGAVFVADGEKVSPGTALAAGALSGLATLSSAAGIAAIMGVTITLAYRRSIRYVVIAVAGWLVMTAPWLVWALRADPSGSVIARLRGLSLDAFIPRAPVGAATPLAGALIPVAPSPLWHTASVAIVGLMLWGAWRLSPKTPGMTSSLIAFLLWTSFWPLAADQSVWIAMPWFLTLLVAGLSAMWQRGPAFKVAVAIATTTCVLSYGWREVTAVKGRRFAAPAVRASAPYTILAPAITVETPPGAVIATNRPALVWLYTGRRAVPFPTRREGREDGRREGETDRVATTAYLCEMQATHIAVTGLDGAETALVDQLTTDLRTGLRTVFQFVGGPGLYRWQCQG